MAQVELLGWYRLQRIIQGYAVGMVEKGDSEVVRHALLVVGEENVATGGEIRLLHQLDQVLDRLKAQIDERQRLLQVFVQPTAEGVGAGFFMEEAPGFALLGVVVLVEVGQHAVDQLASRQLCRGVMKHRWGAVRFFVDVVNDAMANRHGEFLKY